MNSLHQLNTKYDLVIFDFDGTIADTSPGIFDAHRFTLKSIKKRIPDDEELRHIIGGNLLRTYQITFGLQKEDAEAAVSIYRERYATKGIHMATLYPGFEEMLKELRAKGLIIGVATLKAESFAKMMLKELGIHEYFDAVCGMNKDDSLSKSDLIERCAKMCERSLQRTLLVGDSLNDYLGAKDAGVSFIGVTYGFGFTKNDDYEFETVSSAKEIVDRV